jgi:hypothetical protein
MTLTTLRTLGTVENVDAIAPPYTENVASKGAQMYHRSQVCERIGMFSQFPSSHGAVAQAAAVFSRHLDVAPTADCTNHIPVPSRVNGFLFRGYSGPEHESLTGFEPGCGESFPSAKLESRGTTTNVHLPLRWNMCKGIVGAHPRFARHKLLLKIQGHGPSDPGSFMEGCTALFSTCMVGLHGPK